VGPAGFCVRPTTMEFETFFAFFFAPSLAADVPYPARLFPPPDSADYGSSTRCVDIVAISFIHCVVFWVFSSVERSWFAANHARASSVIPLAQHAMRQWVLKVWFFGQFCVISKMAITAERFNQIWLQDKYKNKFFKLPSMYIWLILLESCIKKSKEFS